MSASEVTAADLAASVTAKSDQLNADDLCGGPLTGRIVRITKGSPEQPMNIHLSSWRQPWKPCKTERRVMSGLWGGDPSAWVGKTIRLVRDPDVIFGKERVGGIRLDGASGIDHVVTQQLNAARGKKAPRAVSPIAGEAKPLHPNEQRLVDNLAANGWLDDAIKDVGRPVAEWGEAEFFAARDFGARRKAEAEAAAAKSAAESAAFGESGGEE